MMSFSIKLFAGNVERRPKEAPATALYTGDTESSNGRPHRDNRDTAALSLQAFERHNDT